jgi:uncharacterized membrane protein
VLKARHAFGSACGCCSCLHGNAAAMQYTTLQLFMLDVIGTYSVAVVLYSVAHGFCYTGVLLGISACTCWLNGAGQWCRTMTCVSF